MKTPNEDGKPTDNMDLLKQKVPACGPGCGCNAVGTSGKTRWVIGVLVLIAAGVLVVRAMVKSEGKPTQPATATFAAPTVTPAPDSDKGPATSPSAAAQAAESSVGTAIGTFAELNTVAAKTDAVFVFVPGKDGAAGTPPTAVMQGAARLMEGKGVKCGLYTLKSGSPDYDQVAAQMSVPGVLAMVKGRGMSAVSGEVTEAKLVQGYVAASNGGSCGPSAGAGCCPK